jgi:3-oxoacyl-[acyl-carrier protein] reductase
MIIIVTGGASGLGEAITRRLALNPDYKVYFTYNKSKTNAEKIEAFFPNAIGIKCNFEIGADISNLQDQISNISPDVLINNAYSGSFIKSHFHKIPIDDFSTEFRYNVLPTILITQAAINSFRKKKTGKIITILTSALLNSPPTGTAVYVANKAYIQELSKVWASENAKYNITSNTVSPSFMLTDFTKNMDERIVEQITENHPLKKNLTVDEVAETVYFLSTASSQINGVDIVINSAVNIK